MLSKVYFLNSLKTNRKYVGLTMREIKERLNEHNTGQNPGTAADAPWEIIAYTTFKDSKTAADFELYCKSGSGFAFSRKRIFND